MDDVRARWVVGADGSGSGVRRWAGLDRFGRNMRRWAFRQHFAIARSTGCMEIHWGERVLADALAAEDLQRYEAAHRQLSKRPAFMADFMLLMDRSAWLRSRALPALAARPDLFANLLAMHVGKLDVAGL